MSVGEGNKVYFLKSLLENRDTFPQQFCNAIDTKCAQGTGSHVSGQVLLPNPVMERGGSSQSLARKRGEISDALLRSGDFSQIHWKVLSQGKLHISQLTTDQHSG